MMVMATGARKRDRRPPHGPRRVPRPLSGRTIRRAPEVVDEMPHRGLWGTITTDHPPLREAVLNNLMVISPRQVGIEIARCGARRPMSERGSRPAPDRHAHSA